MFFKKKRGFEQEVKFIRNLPVRLEIINDSFTFGFCTTEQFRVSWVKINIIYYCQTRIYFCCWVLCWLLCLIKVFSFLLLRYNSHINKSFIHLIYIFWRNVSAASLSNFISCFGAGFCSFFFSKLLYRWRNCYAVRRNTWKELLNSFSTSRKASAFLAKEASFVSLHSIMSTLFWTNSNNNFVSNYADNKTSKEKEIAVFHVISFVHWAF